MAKFASRPWLRPLLPLFSVALLSCSHNDAPVPDDAPPGPCAAQGLSEKSRLPAGDAQGHRDPLGAKAAKQARASRISDPAWIRQADTARHPVRTGDYLLINDKIAVYIEAPGVSDGYQPFGGEILSLDTVGPDGKPSGNSLYGETIMALGRQVLKAETVSVINDGSDGNAAVIRTSGVLTDLPFLEFLGSVFADNFYLPAAIDYILLPGAESVKLRLHILNTRDEELPLYRYQLFVLFQSSRGQLFTEKAGYGDLNGDQQWLGFDSGDSSFAMHFLSGSYTPLLGRSGSIIGRGAGLTAKACSPLSTDYVEFIVGGPHSDGLSEAVRRVLGQPAYRAVTGTVTDTSGAPQAGAYVHALRSGGGGYIARTQTNARGEYTLHLPAEPVELSATQYGQPPSVKKIVAPTENTANLKMEATGTLSVTAVEKGSGVALPVRVQVIPQAGPPSFPDSYGVRDEAGGRSVQEFAVSGSTKLAIPAGKQRVIISRGPEWDLFDQTVTVESGKTTEVRAELLHTVDSQGVMCADFHIHSYFSADSSDDVEYKVKGAIADGLEIPISSEHEYIIDFQPIVRRLGLTRWAFGMPSEEFTTFAWGHFGVIPISPRPDEPNRGAVQWYGKKPPEVFHTIAQLPEKPVLIVNHPRSDSFGGYFSSVSFDRATVSGDPDLYSDEYGALEVFNDSDFESNRNAIVQDWFALLNAGKKVWAVGSSDSHGLRTSPVGYPRTCLRFGHDDPTRLSAETVRDVLRAGKAVVSGGLYMTVKGPDGEGPGEQIRSAGRPVQFQVVVQSPSWLTAKRLETIVDGETIATEELRETVTPQGHRYETTVNVMGKPGRSQHWVVFHASAGGLDLTPVHPGRRPFAVSNPIFF